MRLTGRPLVFAMCLGQLGNLLPHVAVPAVMPQHLMPLWGLSGAQAGMMASAFAFGYMLAVPVLTTLTDRIDARNILAIGSAALALATLAFGLLADGLWSATAIWGLAGAGFAGAYMPGLKALTDRLPPGDASRSITLYTSSFSFGVGLSFLVSQIVADQFGWRWAFLASGLGPLVMVAVCLAMPGVKPAATQRHLLDFRPVVRNRPAMGYMLATARIASSFTASAPGLSHSGLSSRRGMAPRRGSGRSSSAWCSRCSPCRRAFSAMKRRCVSGGIGR